MNAVSEPVAFAIPKKPRIKEKDAPPDQRKLAVVPIRALNDDRVTDGAFRVLALLCSYCNRAGITWVSQKRLSEDMKSSRQNITNQLAKLREAGYVEIIRKGFRGERCNTLRVIFDPSVTAEEAIAMTSNKEDTRPPAIREEQERLASEQIDREGQAKIAKLISQALKQPTKQKGYDMPKPGESRFAKEVKEAVAKAKAKRSKPVEKTVDDKAPIGNPPVSNESNPEVSNESLHRQPIGHSGVSLNTGRTLVDKELKVIEVTNSELNNFKTSNVLRNLEVTDFDFLIDSGMKPEQVESCATTLLPLFQSEGIKPSSRVLADSILQLHRDAR